MANEQIGKMPNLIYKFMCTLGLDVHPFVLHLLPLRPIDNLHHYLICVLSFLV